MAKTHYCPPKNNHECPPCMPTMDECPNHPDLYLLRDAAADERGAIADYLSCALETCFDEIFLDVAEDEMQHYVETMRLITLFDPVQAQMLEEENLDVLVMRRRVCNSKWCPNNILEEQDVQVPLPNKKDLSAIRCLTKAIQDELHAINKYQQYMNQAKDQRVKELFCELMNEEKEHVAEFTAALFQLTHEPILEETD